jgi:hypothetical protein
MAIRTDIRLVDPCLEQRFVNKQGHLFAGRVGLGVL